MKMLKSEEVSFTKLLSPTIIKDTELYKQLPEDSDLRCTINAW